MGMYDTIRCEYKEMSDEDKKREYQTKDLDNGLDKYIIKEDGSLWVEEFDLEESNESVQIGSNKVRAYKKVNDRESKLNLTETVYFYDYDSETNTEVAYKVQWTEGELTYFKKSSDD